MESYPNRTNFDDRDMLDGGTDMDQGPGSRATSTQPEPEGLAAEAGGAKQKASDMLHGARDRAERVSETVKNKMSSATNYVKNVQAGDMWGDVKELARRNPGASMLAVAVIGFAIGRSTSRSHSR